MNDPAHHEDGVRIDVMRGVDGARTLREGVLRLADELVVEPRRRGVLVLTDSAIAHERLVSEWERVERVVRPELLERMAVCIERRGRMRGVPSDPDPRLGREIAARLREREQESPRVLRRHYDFVIRKVLLYRLFMEAEPVSMGWLCRAAGCSAPTAQRAVQALGGLAERTSDRRVELRYFPREEFARFVASSDRARSTVRFMDVSGQARSPEFYVRRLEKLRPAGVALGGAIGARHYFNDLDLVGAPRLDLSIHTPDGRMDLDFVRELDPALRPERDPMKPAAIVIHAVRHAESFFEARSGGLSWADPVECLIDLHEAGLEAQAAQFLAWLERRAKEWDRA